MINTRIFLASSTALVCLAAGGSFNSNEEEAFAQLDRAIFDHGINFIDTAELYPVAFNYGKTTEKWIGNWLSSRKEQDRIKRSDLYIATKSNPNRTGGFPDGEERPDGYVHSFDADIVEQSCRASIERMQCEYIDLYQLHWPTRDVPVFGCASFYPKGVNRPSPIADMLAPGDPGVEMFERQVTPPWSTTDSSVCCTKGPSRLESTPACLRRSKP